MVNTPRSSRSRSVRSTTISESPGGNVPDYPAVPLWTLWSIWDPRLSELVQPGPRGSAKRQRLDQSAFRNAFLERCKELLPSFNFPASTDFLTVEVTDEINIPEHREFGVVPIRFCDFDDYRAPRANWTIKAYMSLGILLSLTFKSEDIILILGGFVDHEEKEIVLNSPNFRTPKISHILHLADHNITKPAIEDIPFSKNWTQFVQEARLQRIYFRDRDFTILKTVQYLHQNVEAALPFTAIRSPLGQKSPSVARLPSSSKSPLVVLDRISQSPSPTPISPPKANRARTGRDSSPVKTIAVLGLEKELDSNRISQSPSPTPISTRKANRARTGRDSSPVKTFGVVGLEKELDSQELLAPTPSPPASKSQANRNSELQSDGIDDIEIVDLGDEDEDQPQRGQEKNASKRSGMRSPKFSSTPRTSVLPGGFFPEGEEEIVEEDEHEATLGRGQVTQIESPSPPPPPVSSPIRRITRMAKPKIDSNNDLNLNWHAKWQCKAEDGKAKYKYESLLAQKNKLDQGNFTPGKPQECVYGVVAQVLQPEQANSYRIRISDSTMKGVLVRIHVSMQENKVGPEIKVKDIIRLHRCRIQQETTDRGTEMVISTTPHHNYVLFNYNPERKGGREILHASSANKITLTANDKIRVKDLWTFAKDCVDLLGASSHSAQPASARKGVVDEQDVQASEEFQLSTPEVSPSSHGSRKSPRSPTQSRQTRSQVSSVSPISAASSRATRGSSLRTDLEVSPNNSIDSQSLTEFRHVHNLNEISGDMAVFAMKCRILGSVYLSKTHELLIRVSDGTSLPHRLKFVNYEKLTAILDPQGNEEEAPFVDISICNIDANPDLSAKITMTEMTPHLWILNNIRITAPEKKSGLKKLVMDASDERTSLERYIDPNEPVEWTDDDSLFLEEQEDLGSSRPRSSNKSFEGPFRSPFSKRNSVKTWSQNTTPGEEDRSKQGVGEEVPPVVLADNEEDDFNPQSPISSASSCYQSCVSQPIGSEDEEGDPLNDTSFTQQNETVIPNPSNELEEMELGAQPSTSSTSQWSSRTLRSSTSVSPSTPVRPSYSLRSSSSESPSPPKSPRRRLHF